MPASPQVRDGFFVQPDQDAFPRSILDKLRDMVSVLDYIPERHHEDIRAGTSSYNCTAAFNAAEDFGQPVYVPPGTYVVTGALSGDFYSFGGVTISGGSVTITTFSGGGGGDAASQTDYETRAAAVAADIDEDADYVRTAGYYAVGDQGGGVYKRVSSEPTFSGTGKFQSADGAWWELVPTSGGVDFLQFGAKPDDSTNCYQAFVDAQSFIAARGQTLVHPFASSRGGLELRLPAGAFVSASTWQIKKASFRIRGVGSGMDSWASTLITFLTGASGIIVHRGDTWGSGLSDSSDEQSGPGADGSIIEGLYIKSVGGTGEVDGIWLRARAKIRDVRVSHFPQDGISIRAGSDGDASIKGNANNWCVDTVYLHQNKRHGLYTRGADSNAGSAHLVEATTNGGFGIHDASFLGNTYVGCHTANNGSNLAQVKFGGNYYYVVQGQETAASTTEPGTNGNVWVLVGAGGDALPLWVSGNTYVAGGAYAATNTNATSVFIGCYSELGNQPPSQMVAPTVILGGYQGAGFSPASTAPIIAAASARGKTAIVDGGMLAANGAQLSKLGGTDGYFLSYTDATTFFRWVPSGGNLIGAMSTLGGFEAFSLTGGSTTFTGGRDAIQPGAFLTTSRFFLGDAGNNARCFTLGTAAPATGNHARGEVVFNRDPSTGGNTGWICVTTGTPGTWVAFGIAGVAQSAAQADTTAADLAALKVDFNALLAKLRTAKLIAT